MVSNTSILWYKCLWCWTEWHNLVTATQLSLENEFINFQFDTLVQYSYLLLSYFYEYVGENSHFRCIELNSKNVRWMKLLKGFAVLSLMECIYSQKYLVRIGLQLEQNSFQSIRGKKALFIMDVQSFYEAVKHSSQMSDIFQNFHEDHY